MARWRGNTTQRGLGYSHQRDRRAAIMALRDGDPCCRCGMPMYRVQAKWLDLDHLIARVLGGTAGPKALAHRRCNRSAGSRLGNQLRAAAPHGQAMAFRRRW